MTTAVTQAKTLQERVGERIRDQIGDLMADEDLKVLVDRALDDAFFKREPIPTNGWNSVQQYKPAPAVQIITDLLKARVDEACGQWLNEHKDEIVKHIDDAIGRGFTTLFSQWLDSKVQNDLYKLSEAIKGGLLR